MYVLECMDMTIVVPRLSLFQESLTLNAPILSSPRNVTKESQIYDNQCTHCTDNLLSDW